MPNNFGIIVCDSSQADTAASLGRHADITSGAAATWQRHKMTVAGPTAITPCKFNKACDGNFTGHVIILMHGNYNAANRAGVLYLEEGTTLTKKTADVLAYVRALNPTHVFIHACGQGAPLVLPWYRGASGFNLANVWSDCVTASMGGTDTKAVKSKFGL